MKTMDGADGSAILNEQAVEDSRQTLRINTLPVSHSVLFDLLLLFQHGHVNLDGDSVKITK